MHVANDKSRPVARGGSIEPSSLHQRRGCTRTIVNHIQHAATSGTTAHAVQSTALLLVHKW